MPRSDEEMRKYFAGFEEKYEALVWFARRLPGDIMDDAPGMKPAVRISIEYGEDVENLQGEHGDWHHGFNSGCLATARLFLAMLEGDEDAPSMFPWLDT